MTIQPDLQALCRASAVHTDETGRQTVWAHVTSAAHLTLYAIHTKRRTEVTEAFGILPGSHGARVHDGLIVGWKPYQT